MNTECGVAVLENKMCHSISGWITAQLPATLFSICVRKQRIARNFREFLAAQGTETQPNGINKCRIRMGIYEDVDDAMKIISQRLECFAFWLFCFVKKKNFFCNSPLSPWRVQGVSGRVVCMRTRFDCGQSQNTYSYTRHPHTLIASIAVANELRKWKKNSILIVRFAFESRSPPPTSTWAFFVSLIFRLHKCAWMERTSNSDVCTNAKCLLQRFPLESRRSLPTLSCVGHVQRPAHEFATGEEGEKKKNGFHQTQLLLTCENGDASSDYTQPLNKSRRWIRYLYRVCSPETIDEAQRMLYAHTLLPMTCRNFSFFVENLFSLANAATAAATDDDDDERNLLDFRQVNYIYIYCVWMVKISSFENWQSFGDAFTPALALRRNFIRTMKVIWCDKIGIWLTFSSSDTSGKYLGAGSVLHWIVWFLIAFAFETFEFERRICGCVFVSDMGVQIPPPMEWKSFFFSKEALRVCVCVHLWIDTVLFPFIECFNICK